MARRHNPRPRWRDFWEAGEVPVLVTGLVVASIWVISDVAPAESGWRFGLPFRVFYTAIAVVGGIVVILLRARPMRPVSSTRGVVMSVSLVYLATVGLLVLVAQIFPQFEAETTPAVEVASAVDRGKALFNNPNAGCFLCHVIEGRGGTRGPDQTNVGERAATRRPGLSAEEYIRESIVDPRAYVLEPYAAIMPTDFATRLTEEEINDLVTYLLTLK